MEKSLTEMAAELVCAQLLSTSMSQEEVTQALHKYFSTLKSFKEAESAGSVEPSQNAAMAETPLKSIHKHKIICLECGEEFRSLSSKHLQEHGLTGKDYRKKWGFSMRQPLCAKELTAQRKEAGKKRGLPENLRKAMLAKKSKTEQVPAKAASAAAKTTPKTRNKATRSRSKAGKTQGATE